MAYNNENHEVKLKLMEKETETEEIKSVYFELYVDNKLINTIDSGIYFSDDGSISEYQGSVYVVDSKYLAVLTPEYTTISSGYVLTFYNNDKQVSDKINVRYGGQSLCKDENCTEIINDLEDLEFDGTTFKYWGQDCNLMENVKYQVTFDGTNVNKTVSEKAGNTYGAGAGC